MAGEFSEATRQLIDERDGGWCIRAHAHEAEGRQRATCQHHRRARGMGGSRDGQTATAANGVSLCDDCHRWAHSYVARAREEGLIVLQAEDPRQVKVRWRRMDVYLREDGSVEQAA